MKQYIVDAFTNEPFSGNPAAVCVMDEWLLEEDMLKLAGETVLAAEFDLAAHIGADRFVFTEIVLDIILSVLAADLKFF